MLNLNRLHPRTKALIVSAVFSVGGVIGWYFAQERSPDSFTTLPFVIFYIVLTINTYHSIKLFSSITPMEDRAQRLVDLLLGISYLFLAYSFANPVGFFIGVLFLFILAPIKYILLLGMIPHSHLLKRKITIDLMGTLLAGVSLASALIGYPTQSAWFLAIMFLAANVYLLLINPMYRLID
jgi:hypothetical protein